MNGASIEFVELSPATRLAATPVLAWIEDARVPHPVASIEAMRLEPSARRTRKLLDGAIGAAFAYATTPTAVPALSATRWAYRLAGLYHLTHRTPALMREAATRFAVADRTALAEWAETKAREERNHDRLALRDLAELGYDAEALVRAVVPTIAERLVRYFEACVRTPDPIGCVGYSYALERLAMTVSADDVRAVDALLPHGARATRCLRVHSAMGTDADHVADTIALVARLSPSERAAVAVACHRAALLCFEPPPAGHPRDEDLTPIVNRFHRRGSNGAGAALSE